MIWFKSNKVETRIANILKGTSAPASSIGDNGQLYLKYVNYEKHYFMNNKIVVIENEDDATDLKLYIVGLTKDTSFLPITDNDLLSYLSDITNGYLKGCSTYDTADSTTQTGILAIGNWGSGIGIHTYIPGWTQYKAGTFYGVLDLTQAPVVASVTPSYQNNPYVDPDTIIDRGILDSFAKVNDQWQDLIGTTIDDILAGGSKYIKATGSFTSASSGGQKVEVNCGFKPDLVMVDMEFGNGFTRATYLSTAWYEETDHPASVWDLRPMENVIYAIVPGSVSGETGITDLTDTGFKYRSNGSNTTNKACTYTAIKFDAEEQTEDRTYLFKDGEWKNQDILSLYGYNTTIENGSLKCTGVHAGVVVDDVSGLDSSVTQYSVYLKVRAGNVNSFSLQTGRNAPTQNLYDIIQYGTDRYSYNTDYISSGTDYLFVLIALSNTDGVFLGAQDIDANSYYYIDEIWLETSAYVIVHS